MRRALLLFEIILLLMLSASAHGARDLYGPYSRMTAERVALDPRDPARVRIGALTYLGGVRLGGNDAAFGGFSAMQVQGDRFLMVSDGGNVLRFRMGADFAPRDVRFGDLPGGPATGWRKNQRDAESLAFDPATGRIWIGFEDYNAIWRYNAALSRGERGMRPVAMADWSVAGGAESMVRLADGRFLAISETSRPKRGKGRIVLLFDRDPTETSAPPLESAYLPPPGYDPSDAVQLPDGRLIVLNRSLSIPDLFTAKLTLVDPRAFRPGALVRGIEIATLAPPLLHDNFEALAVTREGAGTILWIASDDNQEIWEQSLLLKFRLEFAKR